MDVARGQAHTLEAFSAAIVLLASVLFALQVTAVTPLTASTASQHIENQQAGVAGGVLDSAAENGTLKDTLLYWDEANGVFHGANEDNLYTIGGPPTQFGEALNETFIDRGIAFDLTIRYVSGEQLRTEPVVDLGTPSDNAVTVERTVTLYDDDRLRDSNEDPTGTELSGSGTYFAPDGRSDDPVYNVLQVELTLWRM